MKPENSTADQDLDLFGKPVLPLKDRRGRKGYAKSRENQELVGNLRAFGMTHAEIATVLGCDEKTLRKYYSRELIEGALTLQAEAISVLVQKMKTGNMAATKQVLEMAGLQPRSSQKVGAEARKPEPLGKKAALKKSAGEVPAGWGDLLDNGKPVN